MQYSHLQSIWNLSGFKLISRFLGEMYVGHFDQTCSLQWPWPHTGEVGNHFAQKLPELWFQGWFVILMVVSMVMAMATTLVSVTSLLELELKLIHYYQSHYREVARWEIFMEQELRFGLDLGRFGNFWGRFFHVFISKK